MEAKTMPIICVGIDQERAEQLGRQVAVALVRGNWDHAHQVIATARHECETEANGRPPADPREIGLHDTKIPLRICSILESHGLFTVGDVLLAGLDYLAERRNIGRASVEVIVTSLLEVGITRDDFMRSQS
jgi:DNA-directed RNA polymerase alpha subunit